MGVLNYIEHLKHEGGLDTAELIEEAFSWTLGPAKGPCEASDVASLRLQLLFQGQLSADTDEILKEVLSQHLEIGKEHALLWSHPDPDIDSLQDIYDRQGQAMARWTLFIGLVNADFPVEAAYRAAYEVFEPPALSFSSSEDRLIWAQALKNEQQRDLLNSRKLLAGQSESHCRLAGDILHFQGLKLRLTPLETPIMALLWDGERHAASEIHLKAYGRRGYKLDIEKLSKRISKLNKKLNLFWGKGPENRWIRRKKLRDELAYQLFKPSAD